MKQATFKCDRCKTEYVVTLPPGVCVVNVDCPYAWQLVAGETAKWEIHGPYTQISEWVDVHHDPEEETP